MTSPPAPLSVGVVPRAGYERRRRLFAALEAAFPVCFEGREPNQERDLDALVKLDGGRPAEAGASGLPLLSLLIEESGAARAPVDNELSEAPEIDRRLRKATLPDSHLGTVLQAGASLEPSERATVLAASGGQPTWIRAGGAESALLAPAELGPDEALRERLCRERSAALLPLVHFLRELTAATRWQPPAARASVIFDDPNLHWPSYGFVRLRELAAHTVAHRYHVALAMIPLDAWFARPAAVRALEQSQGGISLLVHGNDHNGGELGRLATESEGVALAAQALRRVDAFERRTGLPVDRVMVPPHERCSEATVHGLRRCGFEAISMTQPFPWLAQPPRSWLARPAEADALVGWRPADFACGMPVLLRHPLSGRDASELVLRSFLDQPLILYGHHDDLLEGLGVLEQAVEEVDRLRETSWSRLSEIAAGSFETRLEGPELAVRLLTRRARIAIPPGAEQIVIEPPTALAEAPPGQLRIDGQPARLGEPTRVDPGTTVEVELPAGDRVDVSAVPSPPRRPLAIARRVAGESRDRLLPLVSRVR